MANVGAINLDVPAMKTIAIIQARMGSQRLPGKVLHTVLGKAMLSYLIERVRRCDLLDSFIVATTREPTDDALAAFCANMGISCYRGSNLDVARRFFDIVNIYSPDVFVRINGDSPLLDQRLIDRGLGYFHNGDYGIVTNVFPRSFPRGQSVEILRSDIFTKTYPKMVRVEDLEHVTTYFYDHSRDYAILNFSCAEDISDCQLSVDTTQDLVMFERIVFSMDRPHWDYTVDEIVKTYKLFLD
jgi:spore coat polysaccharide biosynthesis protein SpsF